MILRCVPGPLLNTPEFCSCSLKVRISRITKVAVWFLLSTTSSLSPFWSLLMLANMAGWPFESTTCPAITALPASPGIAPYLYQPTVLGVLGALISPDEVRPTYSISVSILTAGICRRTGRPLYVSAGADIGVTEFFWLGFRAGSLLMDNVECAISRALQTRPIAVITSRVRLRVVARFLAIDL
jgi:hypothetical protein